MTGTGLNWCYNHCAKGLAMPTEPCKHATTILIAKDEHEEYRECLDCGEIFDPTERGSAPQPAQTFGESLSDA
jgi:hypothetical protein